MNRTILIINRAGNPFVSRMWLRGVARYARTTNWQIETVTVLFDDEVEQRKVRESIRLYRPDGVISATVGGLTNGVLAKIPHVWMDAPAARISAGDSLIWHDGAATGEMAAQEFHRLGFRHCAAIGERPNRTWSKLRIESFARQVRRQGGTLCKMSLREEPTDKVKSLAAIEPWLRKVPTPCGLFAVNDQIASVILSAARRIGLRVPEDLAVIGVDNDEDICTLSSPPLSSFATDWEKGGFMVAEALDRLMDNPMAGPIRASFGELGLIRRASSSHSPTRVDPRVAEASAYIRKHACEGIGVDDVVRQMGCSRSLAMMRYLKATGRSIFAEIREAQFAQVLVLLSRRDIQIGAIADRCGWKSPVALRTYFEKRLGMTMREWRTRNVAS